MRHGLFAVAIGAAMFMATAHAREPVLSWTIQGLDASGNPLSKEANQSSHSRANLQARTICDQAMATRMGWPVASAVLVTVSAETRTRSATIPCTEYQADPNALARYIPQPHTKPPPTVKPKNSFWD